MTRYPVIALATAILCGCNASQPTFNPLAPYGSPRVPPPATNSLGAGGEYYQNAAPPRTAVPTVRANSGTAAAAPSVSGASVAAQGDWQSVDKAEGSGRSSVVQASHQEPSSAAGDASPGPTATEFGIPGLKPMPVNDATEWAVPAEPATFTPPPSTSPIPTAGPAPAAAPGALLTATARSSDSLAPANNASAATGENAGENAGSELKWRERPAP